MVKYSCERCGKEFSQKSHYDSHNRRKTPCENNADKIKALVDKAVEEKLKELNNKKLIVENEEVIVNTEVMDTHQSKQPKKFKIKKKHLVNVKPKLNVLSLFSGCGGLDYGFETDDNFCVVKAYDFNKDAVETYNFNFEGNKAEYFDVNQINIDNFKDIDLIIGGPPCQDFSVAGKKKLGDRSSMTTKFIEIICDIKPKYFIMENVPTIKSVGKDIYTNIISKLKENNYGLTENIVNMSDYGVPSLRKRIIIIGVLNDCDGVLQEYFESQKNKCNSLTEYLTKNNISLDTQLKDIYRHPCNYSRRGVFSFDELYPTIRGCMRRMPPKYKFHEGDTCKIRDQILNPTIDIISKIQTFPDSFKFIEKKNNQLLIGNSVPPLMSIKLRNILLSYVNK